MALFYIESSRTVFIHHPTLTECSTSPGATQRVREEKHCQMPSGLTYDMLQASKIALTSLF